MNDLRTWWPWPPNWLDTNGLPAVSLTARAVRLRKGALAYKARSTAIAVGWHTKAAAQTTVNANPARNQAMTILILTTVHSKTKIRLNASHISTYHPSPDGTTNIWEANSDESTFFNVTESVEEIDSMLRDTGWFVVASVPATATNVKV